MKSFRRLNSKKPILPYCALCLLLWSAPAWPLAGDPDPTFDGDGEVSFVSTADSEDAGVMVPLADGDILVSGFRYVAGPPGTDPTPGYLLRLNDDGSLDTAFGSGGRVRFAGSARDVKVADNRIYVFDAGQVFRFDMSGTPDPSFGSGGVASLAGLGFNVARGAIDSTGRVVVLGGLPPPSIDEPGQTWLGRLLSDGSVDTGFGTAGKARVSVAGDNAYDSASVVLLQPDDKILVLGSSWWENGPDVEPGDEEELPDDEAVAANGGSTMAVLRFDTTGAPDVGFSGNGKTLIAPTNWLVLERAMFLAPDGRLTIVGTSQELALSSDDLVSSVVLTRINADGTYDTSFNGTGIVYAEEPFHFLLDAAIVQPDGKPLLHGFLDYVGDYYLLRFSADGSLDTSYGDGGYVQSPRTDWMTTDAQGRLLMASSVLTDLGGGNYDRDPVVYRRQADCVVNGVIDAGEECDPDYPGTIGCSASCRLADCVTASPCGPSVCYAPATAGTPCDDGNACTVDACDGGGACVGSAAPATGCVLATRSSLLLKEAPRQVLTWKWLEDPSASGTYLMADPLTGGVGYQLCIFDGAGQLITATIPPGRKCSGKFCWSTNVYHDPYRYRDTTYTASGIGSLLVDHEQGKITLKGKGSNLPQSSGALSDPVKVQLIRRFGIGADEDPALHACFEGTFAGDDIRVSTPTLFKGRFAP